VQDPGDRLRLGVGNDAVGDPPIGHPVWPRAWRSMSPCRAPIAVV
jgi:hypothetical protein